MADLILGVEIGGTKLQLGIGSAAGELFDVHQEKVEVAEGGAGIRRWLKSSIPQFLQSGDQRYGAIKAIGVGFGGPLNSKEGRVLESIQISGWENFPIKEWFQENFHLPTTVDNDSNAATWGEFRLGFGRGSQNFFYTNLGSGVGGGFVLNGTLFDGQGFGAGEFGHTYVPDWTTEIPGKAREIEALCSGWAIESRLSTPGYIPETSSLEQAPGDEVEKITAKDLAEAALHGDPFAEAEIDRIASSIGLGLANVLSLTGVERIAIGGGVSNMGELLIEPIRKFTRQYEFVSSRGKYEIGQCQLGQVIVLKGAVLIAAEAFALD